MFMEYWSHSKSVNMKLNKIKLKRIKIVNSIITNSKITIIITITTIIIIRLIITSNHPHKFKLYNLKSLINIKPPHNNLNLIERQLFHFQRHKSIIIIIINSKI